MNKYPNDLSSDRPFEQRLGEPSKALAALGFVVLQFNLLKEHVATALGKLTRECQCLIGTDASRLPFMSQLQLIHLAVRVLVPTTRFNVAPGNDQWLCWDEIHSQCTHAHELVQIVCNLSHSDVYWDKQDEDMVAECDPGVRCYLEAGKWDGLKLLGVAEYVARAAAYVNEFFLYQK